MRLRPAITSTGTNVVCSAEFRILQGARTRQNAVSIVTALAMRRPIRQGPTAIKYAAKTSGSSQKTLRVSAVSPIRMPTPAHGHNEESSKAREIASNAALSKRIHRTSDSSKLLYHNSEG